MALVNRKDITSIIFRSGLLQKDQLLCMLLSLRTPQSLQSLGEFSHHHTPPVEITEHWALGLIFRSGQ